jgi:hypothetical protein
MDPNSMSGDAADQLRIKSVETLFDERLRQLDTNNDGFVTLGDVVHNFENLGLKVSDLEVNLLAEALHVVAPVQPPATAAGIVPPTASPPPAVASFGRAHFEEGQCISSCCSRSLASLRTASSRT